MNYDKNQILKNALPIIPTDLSLDPSLILQTELRLVPPSTPYVPESGPFITPYRTAFGPSQHSLRT